MASEKITAIIDAVKALTVLELSDLVKAIEEEFGVTAAAPVAVMGVAAAAPAEEEKTEFTPVLADFGAKKLDVIKVKTFSERQCITRELMLLKVKYNKNNRREIMELCEIMKAQIVDMSKHFMMIQICDTPDKIELMIHMLQSISIVEVARTGTLALSKCMENDD